MPRKAIVGDRRRRVIDDPMPSRKAQSKLPMKSLSNGTCASEKPTTTQRTGTISRHQKFIISMFRTFRLRSMPP